MGSYISFLVFQPPFRSARLTFLDKQIVLEGHVKACWFNNKASQTILYSHANAVDIYDMYDYAHRLGMLLKTNILMYEYPGYAGSEIYPSESLCFDAISVAFRFLVNTERIPAERIIVFGQSVGTGPSCYLAEKCCKEGIQLGGLILQSGFASIFRVAFDFRFSCVGDIFCNIDRLANTALPVMLIHGTRDEVVPFSHAEELFLQIPERFRYKPLWIIGGTHNDIEADTDLFLSSISDFISAVRMDDRI